MLFRKNICIEKEEPFVKKIKREKENRTKHETLKKMKI